MIIMKKKYYNYLIFFALIFLITLSFIKKNNFIIFTISPIKTHELGNIKIINSELENNFLRGYLNFIKKKFSQFYIDDYTYDEINKIYPNIKIVNNREYFTVIIKDNEKNIEDIERVVMLLNNFLSNQLTTMNLKYIEIEILKSFDRMFYKYKKKEYEELKEHKLLYLKLNKEIKNKYVRFFKVLKEF